MCRSIVDIQSVTTKTRRGKKEEEITVAEYNGLPITTYEWL